MGSRMMHSESGGISTQPYGLMASQVNYSCSREHINTVLLSNAEEVSAKIFFDEKCVNVDFSSKDSVSVTTKHSETGKTTTFVANYIIGCDGAFSKVRESMERRLRFDYSQRFLEHIYKELTISAGPNGTHQLPKNYLHIWPRHSFMLIALPNEDGSFTCTLFCKLDYLHDEIEKNEEDEKKRLANVVAFFEKQFPDIAQSITPSLEDHWIKNPVGNLCEVRCNPWHVLHEKSQTESSGVVLLGDAAHAMVPFHGQGLNCGLQDVSVFIKMVREQLDANSAQFGTRQGALGHAIARFSHEYSKEATAIQDMALNNYLEMRHHVSSTSFLLRSAFERQLGRFFPLLFLPRYVMTTFHPEIPYSQVVKRTKRQAFILDTFFYLGRVTLSTVGTWAFFTKLGVKYPREATIIYVIAYFFVKNIIVTPIASWCSEFLKLSHN
eukprot:comp20856_c0_seq2/m.43284 comp20856_c0_seq2/g.43284  ORF comp20856_c0_seq2/g.43284 comp20856_c0_seq2/m.43284 type:complete len:438 (-) comp20856_c0_seq2:73-1386(-)